MVIYLYIKTKNFQSLKKFSKTFFKLFFKNKIKKIKYYPLIKKRTLFSLLKSPHVNKTSQEQYEFIKSSRKIKIHTKYCLKSIFIINSLYNKIFSSDIKIKILFSTHNTHKKSFSLLRNKHIFYKKLNLLDVIGEKNLKISCNKTIRRTFK